MQAAPLDITAVPLPLRPLAFFVTAALHALAREETAGRRSTRLLEPGWATWTRFRGRLGPADFVDLVIEDAAVTQPHPFASPPGVIAALPEDIVLRWLQDLPSLDLRAPPTDYLQAQARRLGVPTRLARSTLPRLKPHQRLLELPGTGGQLAFHVVHSSPDLIFAESVTIACASPSELLLAGLCAVECGARGDLALSIDPDLARARALAPDLLVGLSADSGGAFTDPTLAGLFPTAIRHLL